MFKWAVVTAFVVGMAAVLAVETLDLDHLMSNEAQPGEIEPVASEQDAGCEDSKPEPLSLRMDGGGHAWGTLQTKDGEIRVVVDTGASMTSLSSEDARRLGLAPHDPKRKQARFQTANGVVMAELDRLLNVRLGHLCVYTLDVAVMPPGALKGSLLGMNFMRKMRKVEVGQGRVVISQ
ncbi:MAG: TIGR02281 family clan AA aspartic protease [Methylacidiphilales bacterium]|nr:TIGR02281 family clan AA aspartic protease [Candidatus Methylacidiphilales bacterium]